MRTNNFNKQQFITTSFRSWVGFLLVGMFFFFSLNVSAQNFEEDLKVVSEKYQSGNYTLTVDYTFFGGYDSDVVLDEQSTMIKKKADYFHTNQFGTEIISNNKYVLIIDHQNEVIAIDEKHKESSKKEKAKVQKEVDELYQQLYTTLGIDPEQVKTTKEDIKTSYLGRKRGKKGYRLSYTNGEYEHLELYINSENLIAEVWMYFRKPMEVEAGVFKKPKVKLEYGKQNLDPTFDKKEFDIKKYIEIGANKEVAIIDNRYAAFELINHLKH